jgi:hypothetical protein
MGKYGSPSLVLTLDDSGGTPRIITAFVLAIGALKITNKTQGNTPFGTGWEGSLVTGVRAGAPIALSGLYDDTALVGTGATLVVTDADAVPGFTRTLSIVIGGGHTYLAEVILQDSAVVPKAGTLSEFTATLLPTGTITQS